MRNIIEYSLKDNYKIEDISAPNAKDKFTIDESLFINYKNTPYWVIGIINVTTRAIHLEISPIREEETLKTIITTLIKIRNVIISDNQAAYHWLNNPINGYIHHVHSHGHRDFGIGTDNTSHIEQLWAHLKNIIKNIYHIIPNENITLFLQESEFRRNINFLSLNERCEEIFQRFKLYEKFENNYILFIRRTFRKNKKN